MPEESGLAIDRESFETNIAKRETGCWEWVGHISDKGYGRFHRRLAHRISYELYKGPIPDGLCVCHECDNPPCVNPEHLWLGTQGENMRDAKDKDRFNRWGGRRRGEKNPKAKLTTENVAEIRRLRGIVRSVDLAAKFGVHYSTIADIQSGRSWK